MTVVKPGRLRRALSLAVTPAEPGAWDVSGGRDPHHVHEHHGELACDCIDYRIRRVRCKHQLSVMLSQVHPSILDGLRRLVPGVTVEAGVGELVS